MLKLIKSLILILILFGLSLQLFYFTLIITNALDAIINPSRSYSPDSDQVREKDH